MHTRFEPLEKGTLGGYAQVQRVLDHSVGQIVALKRPTPNMPEAARQLEMEIEVLSRVQHPHLIGLHGHGTDVGGPFAVLAWIEGSTLESTLSHAPLIEDHVRKLLTQLMTALQALHQADYAHGDLNSTNVLCSEDDHATLIDLGNAASLSMPVNRTTGSIYSMAPELFDYQPLSVATDLYALGVLAYQALTGQLPFQGETKPQVITAHHRHLRVPLRECCQASSELETLVEDLIAVKPEQRTAALRIWNPAC